MDDAERDGANLEALATRRLCLTGSVAVGVVSAVLLTATGDRMAQAQETQAVMAGADAARGRALFVRKGCVACHAVREVGGTSAPPLDAEAAPGEVDPLDFVARMWQGAEAMIFMQQEEFGAELDFTGEELADIIAFAHDPEEQEELSAADIPPALRRLIRRD